MTQTYRGPFIVGSMFPKSPRGRSFLSFPGALKYLQRQSATRGMPFQMHDGAGEIIVRTACYSDGSLFIQYRTFGEEMSPLPESPTPPSDLDPGNRVLHSTTATLDVTKPLTRMKKVRSPASEIHQGRGKKILRFREKDSVKTVVIRSREQHAETLRKKRRKTNADR